MPRGAYLLISQGEPNRCVYTKLRLIVLRSSENAIKISREKVTQYFLEKKSERKCLNTAMETLVLV